VRAARWAAAPLVALVLVGCTPDGDATADRPDATPTATAAAAAGDGTADLQPASAVARLSVVAVGTADGTNQQAQVRLVPQVAATGDVEVRIQEGDFWLVVDPASVPSWQGLLPAGTEAPAGYAEAWTMPTTGGRGLGMLPANPSGMSPGGGQQSLVTRWRGWSVAPGTSSADLEGGPGALVFDVPLRDDGSLGVRGLALLDADRAPVAWVPVDAWPQETDPAAF